MTFPSSGRAKPPVSSPIRPVSGTGTGKTFFIPTGVERVAIPRGEPPWSCKSYEQVIRGATRKRTGEGKRGGGGRG